MVYIQMVVFKPEDSYTVGSDSDIYFDGFSVSLDEWMNIELDESALNAELKHIFGTEDPYDLRSIDFPKNLYSDVILLYRPDETQQIMPLYPEEVSSQSVYRGREMFETITRVSSPTGVNKSETNILGGTAEVPRSNESDHTEMHLYSPYSEEPVAYIPMVYDKSISTIIDTCSESAISYDGIYCAPDKYLCVLCGLEDLYMRKMI